MLPPHLQRMALFKVNTGCREEDFCGLRWEWEVKVPELETSVFIIPVGKVKHLMERLVVLNKVAESIITEVRGDHPERVFAYNGKPADSMNNSAWKRAVKRLNFHVRDHGLKHTFGRRLRAAGVGYETRQDLLGHKSANITTHYSAVELTELIEAANRVCATGKMRRNL